jgi:HD-GYP domain-containing protein (c-di-GMP phosphodiesterase class II)
MPCSGTARGRRLSSALSPRRSRKTSEDCGQSQNWPMSAPLRLADLLGGLSIVADLGFGLPPETAMRSCLIGTALARELGVAEDEVADTFYASLLLHIGCTAFAHEAAAAMGDELTVNSAVAKTNFADPRDVLKTFIPEATRGMSPLSQVRATTFIVTRGKSFGKRHETASCEVARETARRLVLPGSLQQALYEVHEWWSGGGAPRGLAGEEIALPARIARVASDAALFDDIGDAELAVDALRRRAGGMLDPSIVQVFIANARPLLAQANEGDPRERILEVEPEPAVERNQNELLHVATAFGDLADLKTPFTHGHSKEVARLATTVADRLRLDAATVSRLHVAALLHDLGRVGISNAIWEKPGPLTAAEWEQVRMHPYHSERILATSHALEPIAPIAGMHHERLDGLGYHRGCRARDIPVACRVLAAADAFQAMTQNRPHREALTPEQAGEELVRDSRSGRLDPDVVAAVLDAAGQRRAGRRRDLRPAGLTEREIEVLRLVAEGCSNPAIAKRLYISRRTAEHHVQHVYTKIGVSSRAAAALFALEHDLLCPSTGF